MGLCQSLSISKGQDFSTRKEIIDVLDNVRLFSIDFFERIDPVIIEDELNNYEPDMPAIKNMMSVVSITLDQAENLIFEAKVERTFNLKQYYDLVSLAYLLFGAVNTDDLQSKVEQLIEVNKLKGTRIFGLEQGTNLIYYT